MNEAVATILGRLKEELKALYGERLRGLYLFGSYARGEADEQSDIDVLIVLDRVDNYAEEVERTSYLVATISLEAERSICCVYVSEEDWQQKKTMFLQNIRQEAVPA